MSYVICPNCKRKRDEEQAPICVICEDIKKQKVRAKENSIINKLEFEDPQARVRRSYSMSDEVKERNLKILKLRNKKYSFQEIADQLRMSKERIRTIFHELVYKKRRR